MDFKAIERVIAAAESHGLDEPDMEVGDLQELLRLAWLLMNMKERSQFMKSDQVTDLLETWGDTV